MEGFVKNNLFSGDYFNETAEAEGGHELPGFVRRVEFQKGMVFVARAEADDALPAVDVKYPHGNTVFSGDSGKKIREGVGEVVIFDHKLAGLIQIIFRLFVSSHAEYFTINSSFVYYFLKNIF